MAHYLVTGGSGFFGTLLVNALLDKGHRVTSIDRLPATAAHPALRAIEGDIADPRAWEAAFAAGRPDTVFHCAALLAHGGLRAADILAANVDGTQSLAEACRQAGVAHVVYLSSNCLWGSGFDRPVREDDPPAPCEAYGQSKWEGETILAGFAQSFGTTIIRCPTIIDEGRLGLLAILFEFIADGKRVWTVGSGDNRYQFIYAADLVDAMLRAAERKARGVFGIGSDDVSTMHDTFQYVIDKAGSASRLGALPRWPTITAMKLAHCLRLSPLGPYHYRMIDASFVFDTAAIKATLDWRPTLSNAEMLWRAYRYYHDNREAIALRDGVSAHRQGVKMGVIRLLKWVS